MKINLVMGFFLPVPPVAGGATEKSWFGLAQEFARRGHEVSILSRQWPGWPDRETRGGIRHLRLPGYDHRPRLLENLWLDLRWSQRVRCALPAADVTVTTAVALPVLLGWRRGQAGQLVVMPARMPRGQYRFYRRLDRVLAISSPVRDAVLAENPRLAPITKLTGWPIRWSELASRSPQAEGSSPVTLGFVGRIHREKGLDLFADALVELQRVPDLPPWQVVWCGPTDIARGGSGEGYARGLDARLRTTLRPGQFELRPPVFDEVELRAVYQKLDIFCYPSVAAGETFGVGVAEAMAAGAAAVVSDLACFRDFVRPGETGEAISTAEAMAPARLATTLAALIREPNRRGRLARAGQTEVRRFDFPVIADHLLAEFSALNKGPTAALLPT